MHAVVDYNCYSREYHGVLVMLRLLSKVRFLTSLTSAVFKLQSTPPPSHFASIDAIRLAPVQIPLAKKLAFAISVTAVSSLQ